MKFDSEKACVDIKDALIKFRQVRTRLVQRRKSERYSRATGNDNDKMLAMREAKTRKVMGDYKEDLNKGLEKIAEILRQIEQGLNET